MSLKGVRRMPRTNKDACTVQIVGVGGQGALTVSRIIGAAALKKGLNIIVSEIHGMAQRGGVVQTTIRLGDAKSPLPFEDDITVLAGFEPLEVYRARGQITEDTVVIISEDPILPISVSSGGKPYPDIKTIIEELRKNVKCVHALSAREKAIEAGNDRATNVVLLGAMIGTQALPFTYEEMRAAIEETLPKRTLEPNLKAYDLGYKGTHGE